MCACVCLDVRMYPIHDVWSRVCMCTDTHLRARVSQCSSVESFSWILTALCSWISEEYFTLVLALNLCSLVCFFPIKFNLKLNTQYVSCRSLNGKSQVRGREERDRGKKETLWDKMRYNVAGEKKKILPQNAPASLFLFCLTIMSILSTRHAEVK